MKMREFHVVIGVFVFVGEMKVMPHTERRRVRVNKIEKNSNEKRNFEEGFENYCCQEGQSRTHTRWKNIKSIKNVS
jgi:hypothetical protein